MNRVCSTQLRQRSACNTTHSKRVRESAKLCACQPHSSTWTLQSPDAAAEHRPPVRPKRSILSTKLPPSSTFRGKPPADAVALLSSLPPAWPLPLPPANTCCGSVSPRAATTSCRLVTMRCSSRQVPGSKAGLGRVAGNLIQQQSAIPCFYSMHTLRRRPSSSTQQQAPSSIPTSSSASYLRQVMHQAEAVQKTPLQLRRLWRAVIAAAAPRGCRLHGRRLAGGCCRCGGGAARGRGSRASGASCRAGSSCRPRAAGDAQFGHLANDALHQRGLACAASSSSSSSSTAILAGAALCFRCAAAAGDPVAAAGMRRAPLRLLHGAAVACCC